MGDLKPIRVFEYDDMKSDFKELKTRLHLHELLDSDKIFLFDDSSHYKIWIWHGSNTTTRMKFIATKLALSIRDRYRIGFKIQAIDESIEPLDFRILLGLEERLDYVDPKTGQPHDQIDADSELFKSLSREKVLLLLEKAKERDDSYKEFEIDNKKFGLREIKKKVLGPEITLKESLHIGVIESVERALKKKALRKIESLMREESVNELAIERKYLPNVFSVDLLELYRLDDGLPALKLPVLEYFKANGIITKYYLYLLQSTLF